MIYSSGEPLIGPDLRGLKDTRMLGIGTSPPVDGQETSEVNSRGLGGQSQGPARGVKDQDRTKIVLDKPLEKRESMLAAGSEGIPL